MDIKFWNQFYSKDEAPKNCSTFAASVVSKISKEDPLLELGCGKFYSRPNFSLMLHLGNGRDALYFASEGITTIALDLSETSIEKLKQGQKSTRENPTFIVADFTRLSTPFNNLQYGTIYSRFTLHSIQAQAASRALEWSFNNLKEGGLLLIEVRSVKDKMCGKGTEVVGEKNAYIHTHYRRFVEKDELISELEKIGFKLESIIESDGLSVYKDDDPVVIRVEARKPSRTLN